MKTQGIISVALGAIGFFTFTCLLLNSNIGPFAYSSLLALLAIVCVVIPVLGRLQQLDLKNLKLTLAKIESAKKEIYAKEESLKEASFILSELIAVSATLGQIHGAAIIEEYGNKVINLKLKKLAESLKLSSNFNNEIFKYGIALAEARKANDSKT